MKSLTLGFFYVLGFSWALAETCVIASNGNWIPLIVYLVLFLLMFSILGCAKVSDRTVEVSGAVFAVLLAVGLVFLAAQTALTGAVVMAVVKGVFSLGFVAVGLLFLMEVLKPSAAG